MTYANDGQVAGLAVGGTAGKNSTPTPLFSTSTQYDSIQRLLSDSLTEGGQTLWSQTRAYDNDGNVLGLSTVVPTQSGGTLTENEAFCYDSLNRLVWAGNNGTPTGGDHCMAPPNGTTMTPYSQSYSYDDLDRTTGGSAGSFTYGDSNQLHAVTSVSSVPNPYAAYDAMGNMTCRNTDAGTTHTCGGSSPTGALMSYDSRGQLANWTAPSGTVGSAHYLYDNEGNRVLTNSANASTTTDTIDFDGYTEVVLSGGTTTTTNYYSANGERLAVKVGSTLSYLASDPLGSNSVALNSAGQVSALEHYSPYGKVDYSWGTMPASYNYAGERLDSQTGLLYDSFRYYDPVTGEYVRSDNVQDNSSGMNPYAYVSGNPETRNDPTGQMSIDGQGDFGYTTPNGDLWTYQRYPQYIINSTPSNCRGYSCDYRTFHYTNAVVHQPPSQGSPSGISNALGIPTIQQTINNPNLSGWQKFTTIAGVVGNDASNIAMGVGILTAGPEIDGAGLLADGTTTLFEDGGSLLDDALSMCGDGLSFAANTPVATARGEQQIGTLKVGEKVWAYNPQTKKMELEPIQKVWLNHDTDLVDLTLVEATKDAHGKMTQKDEVLHTNERHPFLTKEKGFIPVSQLKPGMHILRADGTYGVVAQLQVVSGGRWMYNLTVAQDHTYAVGTEQWIVHNINCGNFAQQAIDWLKSPDGANKLNHIFNNSQHDHMWPLTGLDQEGNLGLIQQVIEDNASAIQGAKAGTEFTGVFGSFSVTVKGYLDADGVFQVNTAYVNSFP